MDSVDRKNRILELKAELAKLLKQEEEEDCGNNEDVLERKCLDLLSVGQFLGAIKLYRSVTGCSLSEGRYAIERLRDKSL